VLVKRIGEWAAQRVSGLRIADYCLCLSGGYVVVEGPRGRAMGFAHIPREDLHDMGGEVREPRLEEVVEMLLDLNPLNRVLGLAMANAVSQYFLGDVVPSGGVPVGREPICLVGNMRPLAERFRREGRTVWVFERSQKLRHGSFSDVEEELLLPKCGTLIITGMTLLNFTIDRILERSQGLNVLTGPTAGVHPEPLRGTKIHYVASMRYNIVAAIRHLKLGNYISLAVHSHLGTPYVISVNKYL